MKQCIEMTTDIYLAITSPNHTNSIAASNIKITIAMQWNNRNRTKNTKTPPKLRWHKTKHSIGLILGSKLFLQCLLKWHKFQKDRLMFFFGIVSLSLARNDFQCQCAMQWVIVFVVKWYLKYQRRSVLFWEETNKR